ncbi:MAG: VanZ family protein [Eubacterium sp.]|nr:VanZ family protein [Eubacterium sp.]MCM1215345.1 VanZ family protein [Lachnospiraceae bacterium]MCM1303641.1 VanZ family protein [Butyrivibrio sp.]MCM1343456.1 VanZ family protein [Muribaculaceae bacterium]MCM1240951.1 VanZ family protein [Lachnospiraceae bacterium]
MFHYICRDLLDALKYLPFATGAGALCFCALTVWDVRRKKERKESVPVVPVTLFVTYLAVIMAITLFSREHGSRRGMDLELFATWGINDRNNAFVIENILLFVPYGIVCPLAFWHIRSFPSCLAMGALTSFLVELIQLCTGRGYFQIDDILTNILGTVAGYLLYFLFWGIRRRRAEKEKKKGRR